MSKSRRVLQPKVPLTEPPKDIIDASAKKLHDIAVESMKLSKEQIDEILERVRSQESEITPIDDVSDLESEEKELFPNQPMSIPEIIKNFPSIVDKLASPKEPITKRLADDHNAALMYAAVGLSKEAAEVMEEVFRFVFYGEPISEKNIICECGDLHYHLQTLMNLMHVDMGILPVVCVAKNRVRYPGLVFDEHYARHENRNKQAEIESIDQAIEAYKEYMTWPKEDTSDRDAEITYLKKSLAEALIEKEKLLDENALLRDQEIIMKNTLNTCRDQFSFYAELHRISGKTIKERTNRRYAKICEDAVS